MAIDQLTYTFVEPAAADRADLQAKAAQPETPSLHHDRGDSHSSSQSEGAAHYRIFPPLADIGWDHRKRNVRFDQIADRLTDRPSAETRCWVEELW